MANSRDSFFGNMNKRKKIFLPYLLALLFLIFTPPLVIYLFPHLIVAGFRAWTTCVQKIEWSYSDSALTDSRAVEVARQCLELCGEENSKLTLIPDHQFGRVSRNEFNPDDVNILWRNSDSPPGKLWTLSTNLDKSKTSVQCRVGYPH